MTQDQKQHRTPIRFKFRLSNLTYQALSPPSPFLLFPNGIRLVGVKLAELISLLCQKMRRTTTYCIRLLENNSMAHGTIMPGSSFSYVSPLFAVPSILKFH